LKNCHKQLIDALTVIYNLCCEIS